MSELSQRVVAWQRRQGRHDLPWSAEREPYRVWLSEVMLQQTQVATVRPYYARFLQRFPTVEALAAAPLDEVLALWAGLGYYSRARNLHACAQAVVAQGGWPRTAAGLAQLPGIGPSTACAIAAFCFDERCAILDGNVQRVLARALGFEHDLARSPALRALWLQAEALLPARASDMPAYTQGLMDLGATVCTPRAPCCEVCPLAVICVAQQQGRQAALPLKIKRLKRTQREHWWLWLMRPRDGAVWLQQRPLRGVWAGLWTLPLFDDEAALQAAAGPVEIEVMPQIRHALTHFDWLLHPRRAAWSARRAPLAQGCWVTPEALPDHALPAPLARLLRG